MKTSEIISYLKTNANELAQQYDSVLRTVINPRGLPVTKSISQSLLTHG